MTEEKNKGTTVNSTCFLFVLLLVILSPVVKGQGDTTVFKPGGKFFGKFYFNYHLHLNDSAKSHGVFEATRCVAGYEYSLSEKVSAVVAIDAAASSTSAYTLIVKCAHIDWKVAKPVTLTMGIIDMTQFNTQEKFWGYRHIMKSYQDEYGFGASNDAGINAEITLHKKLTMNLLMVNGEGNKKVQDDFGMHRFGGNLIASPVKGLTVKVAADMNPGRYGKFEYEWGVQDTSTIYVYSLFAGYKFKEKFRLGGEYNIMKNGVKYHITADGYDLSGYSLYGTYHITKKWELLARYDHVESNRPGQTTLPWNVAFDGDLLLGGIQYNHVKGFNIALNYRQWMYSQQSFPDESWLYLNLNYSF